MHEIDFNRLAQFEENLNHSSIIFCCWRDLVLQRWKYILLFFFKILKNQTFSANDREEVEDQGYLRSQQSSWNAFNIR